MNLLQIGLTAKNFSYDPGSLVITDEPISDESAKHFIPGENGLNTLPMRYREAREFAAGLFPDKDLMTYRNGRRALTRLVTKADSLAAIKYSRNDDDQEAKGVLHFEEGGRHQSIHELVRAGVERAVIYFADVFTVHVIS